MLHIERKHKARNWTFDLIQLLCFSSINSILLGIKWGNRDKLSGVYLYFGIQSDGKKSSFPFQNFDKHEVGVKSEF